MPGSSQSAERAGARWETRVEKEIREAHERGAFDNLQGQGRPLPTEPWEGDWALAYHVLKLAGETLPWIALGRDIEIAESRLEAMLHKAAGLRGAERQRARKRFLREAAALDKLLEEYAFSVPVRDLERGRLPPHIAASRFDKACPC